jgi:hypothetical protein
MKEGADGKLAIWASKTYRGHCMPPNEDILADYNQSILIGFYLQVYAA